MKTQLGVLFGSRSCEREVSIISAIQLMNHVDTEKYDVIPIYISEQGVWYTGEALRRIETFQHFSPDRAGIEQVQLDTTAGSGALLATRAGKGLFGHATQVVVARLEVCVVVMHGLNGEDGTLQGMLEMANLPYTSTGVAGSAIGMDKIMMKQFFRGADLPVLPGTWYTRSRFEREREKVLDDVEAQLGYPVFVKPANAGSSVGITKARDRAGLIAGIEKAFAHDRYVLLEEAIDGREVEVAVLGGERDFVSACGEIAPNSDFYDYDTKYVSDTAEYYIPARIAPKTAETVRTAAGKIFRTLGCTGLSRVDFFVTPDEAVYFNEINTIPGFTAISMYPRLMRQSGVDGPALIDRLVEDALGR